MDQKSKRNLESHAVWEELLKNSHSRLHKRFAEGSHTRPDDGTIMVNYSAQCRE